MASYLGIIADAQELPDYDGETLATHLEDLGLEQANLGAFAAAEKAYLESLAIYQKLHGPQSFAAATAAIRYARLLTITGREAEADQQFEGALKAGRQQRNSQNALVNSALRWLVTLRLQQGRLAEAELIIAEVRRNEIAARGALSQQVVHSGYLLAQLRELQGRPSEAEALVRTALDEQQRVPIALLYGEARKLADRISYQLLLVRVLAQQGRPAEARAVFDSIGRAVLASSAVSPLEEAAALTAEGLLLRSEGQLVASQAALQKALARSARLLGAENPTTQQLQRVALQT